MTAHLAFIPGTIVAAHAADPFVYGASSESRFEVHDVTPSGRYVTVRDLKIGSTYTIRATDWKVVAHLEGAK